MKLTEAREELVKIIDGAEYPNEAAKFQVEYHLNMAAQLMFDIETPPVLEE